MTSTKTFVPGSAWSWAGYSVARQLHAIATHARQSHEIGLARLDELRRIHVVRHG